MRKRRRTKWLPVWFLGGAGGIACLALAVAIIFSQQGHEPRTKTVAKKRKPPIVQQVEPQERAPAVRQPKEADLELIARYRRELKDIQNGIEATKEQNGDNAQTTGDQIGGWNASNTRRTAGKHPTAESGRS
jgi:hypothetical protein